MLRYFRLTLLVILASSPLCPLINAQTDLPGLKNLIEPWGLDFGFLVSPENVGNPVYENTVTREATVATVTAYWKIQVHNEGREEYDWSGYGGKGQTRIESASDIPKAWSMLACDHAVLEAFVDFTCELSVIAAR